MHTIVIACPSQVASPLQPCAASRGRHGWLSTLRGQQKGVPVLDTWCCCDHTCSACIPHSRSVSTCQKAGLFGVRL